METPIFGNSKKRTVFRTSLVVATSLGLLAAITYFGWTPGSRAEVPAEQMKLIDRALGSDDEAERLTASRRLAELNREALKRIKRLQVVITTYSDANLRISLALPDTAQKLLQDSGIVLQATPRPPAEAVLRIHACGQPRGASYGGTVHYTSALVGGVLLLELDGRVEYVSTFSSEPPTTLLVPAYCCLEQGSAPFEQVFGMGLMPPLAVITNPRGVEPLLAILGNHGEYPAVRQAAIRGLAGLNDPRAVEPLIAELNSPIVCEDAAAALSRFKDPRAFKALVGALREDFHTLQAAAAEALAQLGDPQAVEPLIAAMRSWKGCCPDGQERIARALGRLGDPRAVEPLIAALKDERYDVRSAAATALGLLRDPRAVEPLIAALNNATPQIDAIGQDASVYVREAAAEALGKLGDPRAVEPLAAALKDDPLKVVAAIALARLKDPRGFARLLADLKDENPGYQRVIFEAFGQIGDPQVLAPLISALKGGSDYTREAAVTALGRLNDPRAVQPLIGALRDDSEKVREQAAIALGRLMDPRAVEPLQSLLSRDCSPAAVTALVRLELRSRQAGGR